MIERSFWLKKIETAWQKRPIVWLAGVRRTGKTTLAKMLRGAEFLNCDLPSTLRRVEDPELFYKGLKKGATVIFDEIHRLEDPTLPLKIAADAFPHLRVLATGSSTLAASKKFRDTLTGRKTNIHLPPVLWTECKGPFGISDLDHRLLVGGLPEPLLGEESKDYAYYSEWFDSFWARDIQELFGIRERTGFLNLLKLLLVQSSGLVDYSALSREIGLSRPTVKAYLEALAAALAVFPLPPYSGGGRREIVKRPKVYAFDTGFVTFARGWDSIRDSDRGLLWEHLVLDVLSVAVDASNLHYWRDKSGREIDFVVTGPGGQVHAIECKINPDRAEPEPLAVFREAYPRGRNYVICPNIGKPYNRPLGNLVVRVGDCDALLGEL